MVKLCASKIYKSGLQNKFISPSYSCLSTLNYGRFYDEAKQAFGNLLFFNEESLAPQQTQTYISNISMTSLIIPLIGSIDCTHHSDTFNLDAEQIQFLKLESGDFYTIKNRLYNNPASYLHIGMKENIHAPVTDTIFLERMNALSRIGDDHSINTRIQAYVGVFDCRVRSTFKRTQKDTGLFVYITNGVFEIQNRFLEQGDALSIRDIAEIKFETLAPNSILILMEIPLC